MTTTDTPTTPPQSPSHAESFLDDILAKCNALMDKYWQDNPDLYRLIQQQKKPETIAPPAASTEPAMVSEKLKNAEKPTPDKFVELRGAKLRQKIQESHRVIRQHVLATNSDIIPRTEAHNCKSGLSSLKEEQDFRADVVSAQIKAWRSMLPSIIRRFSKIKDYRRTTHIKHKIAVLLVFGLFAFIFRLQSQREMNRELTGPVIFKQLQKIFPEIDTIPHSGTLKRLLDKTDPLEIEKIHISLIKDLIRKKKFKKMLIQGCLPISVDGTQKLYRKGLLQDDPWCEREVGNADPKEKQQYIYALEANITLQNGLTIPVMTEYLSKSNNQLENSDDKQDNEITAFERISERLKKYFPRQKIIILADAMFAVQSVMGDIHKKNWEFTIKLPKRKLTDFAKLLNKQKNNAVEIPDQSHYRKRKQSFYWLNDVPTGYEWELNVSLVACFEEYYNVNIKTGEIESCFSEHCWISSIRIDRNHLHALLNLGARKLAGIEDSINTAKNRGYNYKHAFCYTWNGMQGFHYLMRLAQCINALSEFTKVIKKYVRDLGCSATLKLIKQTLFNPWLPEKWFEKQRQQPAWLNLQLE